METAMKIRGWILGDGRSIRAVARETGISRTTIKKYLKDPEHLASQFADRPNLIAQNVAAQYADIFEQNADGFTAESRPVWSIDITDDLREKAMEPMAILRRDSVIDEQKVTALLPDLKKRLDKMMIRGVDLRFEPGMAEQGATEIRPNGDISILIGAALNDVATLNHEAVHVLRARGLFKDREWKLRMREAAENDWMETLRHRGSATPTSSARAADRGSRGRGLRGLDRQGNLKVADAPKGGLARIKRFFKALIEALRGQGITTPSDVFRNVESGAVGGERGRSGGKSR